MLIIFNTVYMEKAKNSGVQLLQKTGIKSLTILNFFSVSYSLNTTASINLSNVFVSQVNIIYPNEKMNKDLPAYTLCIAPTRKQVCIFSRSKITYQLFFNGYRRLSLCAEFHPLKKKNDDEMFVYFKLFVMARNRFSNCKCTSYFSCI